LIDSTEAAGIFGAMLILASIGWAFMGPLRDAADALADEQRSIIPGRGDGQRASAGKVKTRYRNWALVTTAIFVVSAVAVLLVLIEMSPDKDFVWQEAVLVSSGLVTAWRCVAFGRVGATSMSFSSAPTSIADS
jgi:hypothetical protein